MQARLWWVGVVILYAVVMVVVVGATSEVQDQPNDLVSAAVRASKAGRDKMQRIKMAARECVVGGGAWLVQCETGEPVSMDHGWEVHQLQ